MSRFNMDVRELFAVSNFPAVLAISVVCACVWDTPDVTRLPVRLLRNCLRRARPGWTRDTGSSMKGHQAIPSGEAVGGNAELDIDSFCG
jgi:hypothetical protein